MNLERFGKRQISMLFFGSIVKTHPLSAFVGLPLAKETMNLRAALK